MALFHTPPCTMCDQISEVDLDPAKVARWIQRGEKIQNVWPELSPDERELLMTGTHPACWTALWADTEED